MKFKKINYIKQFWSFKNFKWDESNINEFHDKWNIIYGINWSWKTTLSELIRSISQWEYTNDIKYKDENHLWKFKITSDLWEFRENNYSENRNIKVFNKRFVEENVFCKWWAKPIILIAENSWEIEEKINIISDRISNLEDYKLQLSKKKDYNQQNINKEMMQCWQQIANDINDKTFNRTKVEQILQKWFKTQILSDVDLTQLKNNLYENGKEKLTILSKFNQNIYSEFYKNVCEVLEQSITADKISFDIWVENRVHEWLLIHKNKDKCEFCWNTINENRINDLLNHFNFEYQKLLDRLDSLLEYEESIVIKYNLFDWSCLYSEYYDKYLEYKNNYEQEIKNINNRLEQLTKFLKEKRKSLSLAQKLDIECYDFQEIANIINDINELIEKHNQKSNDLQNIKEYSKEKIKNHYCSLIYKKFISFLWKNRILWKKILSRKRRINELKIEKESLQLKVKPEIIAAENISKNISIITGNDDIYLKYTNEWYEIIRKSIWKPFSPSEWECTIIGFAYFLTKLKEVDTDIIIFDDPMSSLDEDNLYRIFSIISLMKNDWKQIFVFTHHYQFLRLFLDESLINNNANYYHINKKKWNSYIYDMEQSLKTYKSEYHFIFKTLYDFWQRTDKWEIDIEICYNYGNMSRKLLEIFTSIYSRESELKAKLTKTFPDELFTKFDREYIYKFINNYSHNNSVDSIKPQDMSIYINTLPDIIEQIMEMIQKKNKEHFEEMIKNR